MRIILKVRKPWVEIRMLSRGAFKQVRAKDAGEPCKSRDGAQDVSGIGARGLC